LSTLYIRYPSKVMADTVSLGMETTCRFAAVSDSNAILQEGILPLQQLAATVAQARQVFLLLAASDVTLLRMKVPALSASRLRTALPNLVEDRLITDPAESVIVAGASDMEGMRTIAVVERAWVEPLARTLQTLGARKLSILPFQLCLPYEPGHVAAAVDRHEYAVELALRLSEHEGIGLPIELEPDANPFESAIRSIRALAPEQPVTLHVPKDIDAFQQSDASDVTLVEDNWATWIAGSKTVPVDFSGGLPGLAAQPFNIKAWRWSIFLAVTIMLVNLGGLYFSWWQLDREAKALNASMAETYRSVFPQETVVVDPIAQMNQKLAAARRNAGQGANDDFTVLAAALGEALSRVTPAQKTPTTPVIASLEYRDRSLSVRWKGETPPVGEVQNALTARNLSLSQPSAGVWQIRGGK